MQNLIDYVRAIHGLPSAVQIAEQHREHSQWRDQGFTVQRQDSLYRFADGVQVRRVIEQDDFPSELACAECWIEYTVLANPAAPAVSPARKTFANACREAYWLRYHSA